MHPIYPACPRGDGRGDLLRTAVSRTPGRMVIGTNYKLPKEVVDVPFWEMFKVRLDGALSNLVYLVADVPVHCRRVRLDSL